MDPWLVLIQAGVTTLLLGIVALLVWLARRRQTVPFRRRPTTTVALAQLLGWTTTAVHAAIAAELAPLGPSQQRAALATIAGAVYRALPDVVVLDVGGRRRTLPLKYLCSAALFTELLVTTWHGRETPSLAMEDDLAGFVANWEAQRRPLPGSGDTVTLVGVR